MVIFEEIYPIHKWLIRWYLFKEKKIYYLRLNIKCRTLLWLKKYINRKDINKINFDFRLNTFDGVYYDLAFDNVDKFFNSIRESILINKIKKLYRNENIELAFKKNLNEKLARFYYLNYIFNELQKKFHNEKIIFIPSNGIELYRTDGCEVYDYLKFYRLTKKVKADLFETENIIFPIWLKIISYIKVSVIRLLIILKLFGLLLILMMKKIKFFKKINLKDNYKYAIMIISPLRQFGNRVQKVDFLIDDNLIKKEDVLFLSYKHLSNNRKKYFEDNGLEYIDDLDNFVSFKYLINIFPLYFLLLSSYKEIVFILDTSLKLIYYYLRWKGFIRKVKIDNLITHCDFGIQSIARNIILEEIKCKTYYYMDSANFGCFLSKENLSNKYRHNNFGFLYYDYFISWNEKVSDYFKESYCNFKNYINLGCFWAEHIREIREGKIKSDFKNRLYSKGFKEWMRLVSVFDSTFHNDSVTTYNDGERFLEDILRMLEELQGIFIVLKQKKSIDYHRKLSFNFDKILDIYSKFYTHPRCFCIKGGEERWASTSEIIAFSELTISFPFTSTTFEALTARKKAIWYDATNKFRNTFYDNIPGLVCHSYEELLNRVNELLFRTSEQEYDNYLDKYVKNKLESYLDGRAISRFRYFLNTGIRLEPEVNNFEFIGERNV